MQASYAKREDVVVVELKGRLDFESAESFRRGLERLLSQKVVFDLRDLNFVGSLGLKDFVDTLDLMAQKSNAGVRFCGVSSEFRRMFEATGLRGQQIYDSADKAIQSFTWPTPVL